MKLLAALEQLYGGDAARVFGPRIQAMLAEFRGRCPAGVDESKSAALTERDALLITYADQLRQEGLAPLQALAGFAETHLASVVSGIHLLPFYPSSSDDGFSVKDYVAVDPAVGTWDDIRRLGTGFDLMFDAVLNHASVQGDWFERFLRDEAGFRDFFVTVAGDPDLSQVVRPRALPLLTEFPSARGPRRVWTTFSADQADLNYQNAEVLRRVLEVLLFYVAQGARYLRLDAIAFLWKEIGTRCLHQPETHAIIRLVRATLEEVAPHVRLITETNVPHEDNISYFGDGTNEAHLVYNFALPPLVLHALQTGSAEKLTRWAQSLALPSEQVTFFNFLASHDGIGLNPARGLLSDAEIEAMVQRTRQRGGFISYKNMPDGTRLPYEMNINYLDALSDAAGGEPPEIAARKSLTAHAILLSLQGVPGLYFHSLLGSRGDRAAAEASGIPRRINREKLDRLRLEAELEDPQSLRGRIWGGLSELLRVRAATRAFHPQAAQRILTTDGRVFAVGRTPGEKHDPVLCLHNVSPEPVRLTGGLAEVLAAQTWTDLLTGQQPKRGGSPPPPAELAGYQTLWLRAESNR